MQKEEFKKEFLKLYEIGLSTTEICKILGENRSKVYHWLQKWGIKSNPPLPQKISIEEIEEITNFYKEGKTIQELHLMFPHINECVITYWLRKQGITRPTGKKCSYNTDYFKEIDTPLKAYFLGLFYAEGSVVLYKNKYAINLELKKEDSYIIEKFAKEINCDLNKIKPIANSYTSLINDKIYTIHKNNMYLHLSSKEMGQDLIKWGCVPKKTFSLKNIPDISTDLKKWFVLGFFDGEGIVSNGEKSRYIGFCGTKDMMKDISKYLSETCQIPIHNSYYNKSNKIYYLRYGMKSGLIEIYNFFYKNNTVFFMRRKKEKIENIIYQNTLTPR